MTAIDEPNHLPVRRRRRRRRRRLRRRILAVGLAVALLGLAVVGVLAASRYVPLLDETRALRVSLEGLVTRADKMGLNLDRRGLDELKEGLADVGGRFGRLASVADSDPIVGLLRNYGPVRDQVAGADALIAAGREVLAAGDEAIAMAERYVAIREAQASDPARQSTMADLVALMAESQDETARALGHFQAARAKAATIPDGLWGPLDGARDLIVQKLAKYEPALEAYAEVRGVLPAILGWGDQKRYLILAQNPAELRPSGGFAGSIGIVSVRDGRIVGLRFEDVGVFDARNRDKVAYVEPPEGLKGHLLGDYSWELADANWSPDFPTSARDAVRLYTHQTGDADIDGVVAITTYALDELLLVTGPITVPEYDVTVAAGETTVTALENTRVSSRPGENRKAWLGVFATEMLGRLFALPPARWEALLPKLEVIRNERRALVWFDDSEAQGLVAEAGWDGVVRQDAGDYLYAVDANVSPVSKLNLVTDRFQRLTVRIDEVGNAHNELELEWTNRVASADGDIIRSLKAGSVSVLGLFTRVLTPARSRIEGVSGGGDVELTGPEILTEEAGRTVFGNYVMVPPGQIAVRWRWISPYAADITDGVGTYRLVVQRQPGTRGDPLTVEITVPEGATITNGSPGLVLDATTATLQTTLLEDVELELQFRVGAP